MSWDSSFDENGDYFPSEFIASALDPRTKDLLFLDEEDANKVLRPTTSILYSVNFKVWSHITTVVSSFDSSPQSSLISLSDAPARSSDPVSQMAKRSTRRRTMTVYPVEIYRSLEPIPFKENPYNWWRAKQGTLPKLAAMAQVSPSY